MFIKKFQIKNFKPFKDITIHFNEDVNILVGENNTGKTSVLEAIALWHECFSRLIMSAGRGTQHYQKGDFILGNTQNKYFPFIDINSIRSPNFQDIFHQRDKKATIHLIAEIVNKNDTLEIGFSIGESGLNYIIQLIGFAQYDFKKLNDFLVNLPKPFGLFYASPVSAIQPNENFVTLPSIEDEILKRNSASVIRNRLHILYNHTDTTIFQRFQTDVSYILFNNQKRFEFISESNRQRDRQIVFEYKLGHADVQKDLALLGSGSLQVIEILLNLYHNDSPKDLTLILLDEPDSHLHRDIQKRLLEVLTKFSGNNQIFLSTHNESLIRSAALKHLFHLENQTIREYKNLLHGNNQVLGEHFKGIVPSVINPLMKSVGSQNGLDFINAIEADTLIFVEGEDDARCISLLLKQRIGNNKKYVFWVLGGVDRIHSDIMAYKTIFSHIKNAKTLWEKSVLIFDKDYWTDKDRAELESLFIEKLNIKTKIWQAYTFESIIFMDLEKAARLLTTWLRLNTIDISADNLLTCLATNYLKTKDTLFAKYKNEEFSKTKVNQYVAIKDKYWEILDAKNAKGRLNTAQKGADVAIAFNNNLQNALENDDLFKFMDKNDVASVINQTFMDLGITKKFSAEKDFESLMSVVNKSTWFNDWDFLNDI